MNEPSKTPHKDPLIDALVGDLRPVRVMKRRDGVLLVLGALAVTVAGGALWIGLRADLMSGGASPLYVIVHGLLLLLGLAAASAVVVMASPQVGAHHDAPKWAMAMVALLPLAAIATSLASGAGAEALFDRQHDLNCLTHGVGYSLLVGVVLFYWLKRGAPVSQSQAGLYLGTAAGALGIFAYGLTCPLEAMNHLGIWHVMPVAIGALVGRFAIPPLLRW